jgi:hypothetical protein
MTRTTSTGARLAALAAGCLLLAGCGSAAPPVAPPRPVAVAATTPALAGARGVVLLRAAERELTARGGRAIRRSGAELLLIAASCAGTGERRFSCETVVRMRRGGECRTVESTQRGTVLPGGDQVWAGRTAGDRANDSRLCP